VSSLVLGRRITSAHSRFLPTALRDAGRPTAIVALGLVAITGAVCLPLPFYGDQALFAVYGRQIAHGAVLYRDIFDVKQPGIFWFYAAGGTLFGYTEVGIHLLELLYWLAFSIFCVRALRPYFDAPWAPALVPIATVAVYYMYASILDLTQIEILVAFPILLAWWLVDRSRPDEAGAVRRFAAAGCAAAFIVLLKYPYVLIAFAMIGSALFRRWRRAPWADVRRSMIGFAVGLMVPIALTTSYFAVHGQLGRIWWAYFELAPRAQLGHGRPLSYFVVGVRHFLLGHGPILILASLGVVRTVRQRVGATVDLAVAMLVWCAAGAVTFFFQGWAEYKWALFTVPVGMLAVVGVEGLFTTTWTVRAWRRPRAVAIGAAIAALSYGVAAQGPRNETLLLSAVAVGVAAAIAIGLEVASAGLRRWASRGLIAGLAVAVGAAAVAPGIKVRSLVDHDLALSVPERAELRVSWNGVYRAVDADLALFRRRDPPPGPMYVLGDPLVLLRAGRAQAVPLLGWGPEIFDDRAWTELETDLRTVRPTYIVIDPFPASLIRKRHPSLMRFIRASYTVAFVGLTGTWYVRRSM
jgi:Dolichyl-phosphate-mannose-protein mannosyltransferase